MIDPSHVMVLPDEGDPMTLSERIAARRPSHPLHDCPCRSQDEHEAALIAERRAAYAPIPQSPFTRRALAGQLPAKDTTAY